MTIRGSRWDRGGAVLEYSVVFLLVAVLGTTVVAATPAVGGIAADAVDRAICSAFGDNCADPADGDPFVWDGVGDEEDRVMVDSEPSPPQSYDEAAVDDMIDRIQQFNDPGCGWWEVLWCSGPDMFDIYTDLSQMSGAELEAVFSELTDEELTRLLSDPSNSPQTGAINYLLEDMWRELSPETRERLRDLLGDPEFGEPSFGDMDLERGYDYEYREMEQGSLWGPNGDPKLFHIDQGTIEDCWWMASMGAIADTHPEILVDMITENPNGTYTVTFPDGEQVTVTGEFPYNTTNGNWAFARPRGVSNPAIWPMVLEKAYAVKMGGYHNIELGFASTGMDTITGGSTTNYLHDDQFVLSDIMPTVANQEDIQRALQEGQEANAPMAAATYHRSISTPEADAIYEDMGLRDSHQYVISEVKEDGSVVLHDPNHISRRYTLTADEFHTAFPLVHIHDPG